MLNTVLTILLVMTGKLIWGQVQSQRTLLTNPHEITELPRSMKPLIPSTALQAASYLEVAQLNLLSPDRNPNIMMESPPAPVAPDPPLPACSGVILLPPSRPIILLSAGADSKKRGYQAGEMVGEWKIESFDWREITLECSGRRITKLLSELSQQSVRTNKLPALPKPSDAVQGLASSTKNTEK